jgi:hypothetical protein
MGWGVMGTCVGMGTALERNKANAMLETKSVPNVKIPKKS